VLGNVVINRWGLLGKLSILEGTYVPVFVLGKGPESGYMALCVQYERELLDWFLQVVCGWGQQQAGLGGFFPPGGGLRNELTFLV
jgi:hypothetical protein